ncbi:MAG: tetratricopeptide repeat protein [Hyphomicrobiaceae bacterium]|nr:tetratricopeptide repeat protein [Hyphomicrobiaceae bacterium]
MGPTTRKSVNSLGNLAELMRTAGRYAEAEPLYQRTIRILEKALGANHPDVGTSLNNLALLFRAQHRDVEAEPLLQRTAKIYEAALGTDHPSFATALHNLGRLYQSQMRLSDAEVLLRRALDIRTAVLGQDHSEVAASLAGLAFVALARNDLSAAAELWQGAGTILQRRTARELGGGDRAGAQKAKGEAQRSGWIFEGLIKARYRLAAGLGRNAEAIAAEMFEVAQWAVGSGAASALAQMAARSANGSSMLAALVRERQDLVVRWQTGDLQLIAARSEPSAKRDMAGEKALSDHLAAIDARLAEIDEGLRREFPDHVALASPKPIAVADVQALLRADEALVLILDTSAFSPLPEETFIWVVTRTGVRWLRSGLGMLTLDAEVAALRCGLDRSAWLDDGGRRCASLLRLPPGHSPPDDVPLPFDASRAHALYKGLLDQAADELKGLHLLVVPNGTLTTLPFQVLISEPPVSNDLATARWLIRDHAITVLPSVASLKALRRDAKSSRGDRPMVGFGNPLLDGNQSDPRHGAYYSQQAAIARARTVCAPSAERRAASHRFVSHSLNAALPFGGRIADPANLRAQAPLPETADELCDVVRSIGGSVDDIRLGARDGG